MYNPAHFREDRPEELHAFIRAHPFGTLVTSGPDGPEASHLPVFLDVNTGDAGRVRCHMARSNPQWRQLASGGRVLMIFTGASHYITPNWYPEKRKHGKVVPTWNYVAVHISGSATVFEDSPSLLRHLHELTNFNEASVEERWSVADAPPEYIEGMARAIVGVEIVVDRVEGKWKLNQNRSAEDQQGVIAGLDGLGSHASREMADLMRNRTSGH